MKNPFPEDVYSTRKQPRETDIRGCYFRDQTAIIHSTAFRRLKNKTQVFFAPDNDHICTRIEHVLHVATIARSICKGLIISGWELDIDMAYAIGLGHDLGHTPFGHAGEVALSQKLGSPTAFIHEINSYRQVEYLANKGKGLNLTFGVKDGILCHNGETDEQKLKPAERPNVLDEIKSRNVSPSSYEGCIMRFSDKIAYLGRDIEDALIAKFIKIEDIPQNVRNVLGDRNGQIIHTLIMDLIEHSKDKDYIGFSDETYQLLTELKAFNYKYIYNHPVLERYDEFCDRIIDNLFNHLTVLLTKYGRDYTAYTKTGIILDKEFGDYLDSMSDFYIGDQNKPEIIVTDYISGMTDVFALQSIKQITIPDSISFF
jgi:dGTPase